MKKLVYLSGIVISLFILSSCVDNEKDLSQGNGNKNTPEEEFDPDFDYNMRTERQIVITAKRADGSLSAGVPFNIYLENPYGEEGVRLNDVQPIYSSSTDANGVLNVKVEISNRVEEIYVVTPYIGYGQNLQTCKLSDYMNLTFQEDTGSTVDTRGVYKNDNLPEEIIRVSKVYAQNTNVFTFYENGTLNSNSGLFNNGQKADPDLILTPQENPMGDLADIATVANTLFPEAATVSDPKYYTETYNSDLVVTKPDNAQEGEYRGTQVWVTLLGDGGFSVSNRQAYNSLCYYTYPTNNPPSASDAATIRKTIIYPNTNMSGGNLAPYIRGSRIQLMYWDGEKYTSLFPAGVSIGWIMISAPNGERDNKDNLINFRFSTPKLNAGNGNQYAAPYTNGIGRWAEEIQCNIVGMENRMHNDPSSLNDKDYNDILFRVDSDPIIKPMDEIPPVDPTEPAGYGRSGVLAFEDNWPNKGDYDFNDFVADYTYKVIPAVEGSTDVQAIQLTFTPRAIGASFGSGFGIQLPVLSSNVKSIDGAILEQGENLATIIVYNNTRSAFGNVSGFINTEAGYNTISGTSVTTKIILNNPISDSDNTLLSKFNPFIYVNSREKEIHLTDMQPTGKVNINLFGTGDDKSKTNENRYYRTDEAFPWALDIPNETKAVWKYPLEGKSIVEAYPDYSKWANKGEHNANWLDHVNSDLIYK